MKEGDGKDKPSERSTPLSEWLTARADADILQSDAVSGTKQNAADACRMTDAVKADATKARRAAPATTVTPRARAGNVGKQGGRRNDGGADAKNSSPKAI